MNWGGLLPVSQRNRVCRALFAGVEVGSPFHANVKHNRWITFQRTWDYLPQLLYHANICIKRRRHTHATESAGNTK